MAIFLDLAIDKVANERLSKLMSNEIICTGFGLLTVHGPWTTDHFKIHAETGEFLVVNSQCDI